MAEDPLGEVRSIIATHRKITIDEIKAESLLREDLGLDSLDALEIVFDVEERFNIKVPEEYSFGFKTVEDVCVAIVKLVAANRGADC